MSTASYHTQHTREFNLKNDGETYCIKQCEWKTDGPAPLIVAEFVCKNYNNFISKPKNNIFQMYLPYSKKILSTLECLNLVWFAFGLNKSTLTKTEKKIMTFTRTNSK